MFNVAVSDYSGKGRLIFPNGPEDADSAYIQKEDNGQVTVKTLNDIVEESEYKITDLALKLDVEGQEQAVINGAEDLIRNARNICLFIELHPAVLQRNSQTAEELLNSVGKIRPFKWYVADKPYLRIDPKKGDVFKQIGGPNVCDVIGYSQGA